MNKKHIIIKGAIILTLAGFASRIIGFFYRIFLSYTIGAEGMGIYQLIFPIYAMSCSLTASGIQTAISKFVSGKMAVGDKKGARNIFITGLTISLALSALACYILFYYADFISVQFLEETRCAELLRLLAYSVPFAAVHSCINGYYYGLRRTNVPAISQLIESLVRMGTSYFLYIIFIEKGIAITPALAVYGMVTEEVVSFLLCSTIIAVHFGNENYKDTPTSSMVTNFKEMLSLSTPLTLNRVLLNLLQSMEALFIPLRLRVYGMDVSTSLSTYGVLTGMSIPLILFPSAITASASTLLLPTVSEAQSAQDGTRITVTIENTIKYSLILGILCTGVFLALGNEMGEVLFHSDLAGPFILTLSWICPFLYLTTTLTSVLNGLGKTTTTFIQSTIGLLLRIGFVWFAVPLFGISGYLWGLLASELVIAFMALRSLKKEYDYSYHVQASIVLPVLALVLSIGIILFARQAVHSLGFVPPPLIELFSLAILLTLSYILLLIVFRVIKLPAK